jgi:ABC-type dipeptide/oligopeptide/nickel transport system permease component
LERFTDGKLNDPSVNLVVKTWKSMTTFIIRRILYIFPVCFGILLATFLIKSIIPTDVVTQMYMGKMSDVQAKAAVENIRHQFHLDEPMIVQLGYYINDVFHGNLGISIRTRQPVTDELLYRYVNTLKLAFTSLIIGILIGVSSGIISAYFKDTWIDFLSMVTGMFGLSMPAFFFGLILIIIFCVDLKWLPIVVLGQGNWKQLILPSLNLGLILSASLSRITRSSMLEVLNQDYIRTARAKGLPERLVVFKHALRNALLPVVTIIGLQVGELLGGAFIIENVFAWHGIGELGVNAIRWKDFTITQGIILISAGTYVIVNLVVDILYKFINPRIRLTEK